MLGQGRRAEQIKLTADHHRRRPGAQAGAYRQVADVRGLQGPVTVTVTAITIPVDNPVRVRPAHEDSRPATARQGSGACCQWVPARRGRAGRGASIDVTVGRGSLGGITYLVCPRLGRPEPGTRQPARPFASGPARLFTSGLHVRALRTRTRPPGITHNL